MTLINELINKRLLSLAVLLLIGFQAGKKIHELHKWEELRGFQGDAMGYYIYLPTAFIYQDFHYDFKQEINERYPNYWFVLYFENESGERYQKYPLGTAVMFTPFFGVAHLLASNSDEHLADGYSGPYHRWIVYGTCIYGLLALFMISKVINLYFNDLIAAIVISLIGLGTNFYYYLCFETGLSHLPGLFLIGVFTYHCILWFRTAKFWNFFWMFFALSIAIIVRPTNIIFGLLFFGMLIENRSSFKEYLRAVLSYKYKWILIVIACLFVPSLQIAVWLHNTGSIIQYSYKEEGFFFSNTHVFYGLFSARNGLFLYSLPFLLSIIGVVCWNKKIPNLTMIVGLSLFYYVIYSWWCWWYGGCYGSRAAIESYVWLALFLGVCLNFILKHFKPVVSLFLVLLFFASTSNMTFRFTDLRDNGLIHYDSMTWQAYKYLHLNDKIGSDYFELWEQPDYHSSVKSGSEYDGFMELNPKSKYSEEISFILDTNSTKTVQVEFEFWGQYAFLGDPVMFIESLNEEIGFYQCSEIKPKFERFEWNKGIFTLPLKKEWQDKEIRFRLIYEGKRRIFYKPLRFTKDKP